MYATFWALHQRYDTMALGLSWVRKPHLRSVYLNNSDEGCYNHGKVN